MWPLKQSQSICTSLDGPAGLCRGCLWEPELPAPRKAPHTGCSWDFTMGIALTFPSVWWQWSHHGNPGACSGMAAWPREGLPSPQKLHLSSGALQVGERLVRDTPSVHIIRKMSRLHAGIAAAGEDSAHFTALTALLEPEDLCASLS